MKHSFDSRWKITHAGVVLFFICFFVFSASLFSCRKKEEISTDPTLSLKFSEDSIFFDTVFSAQGTAWQYLWVFNRNSAALKFDEITLADGDASSFDLLLNGQYRKSATNITIPGNDSMLLLVRANINPQNLSTPYLVRDYIVFKRAGVVQNFDLWAYGQDATYLTNHTCACNEVWSAGKPYVITGTTLVNAGCTLTIKPGTKVFLHSEAALHIEGTLLANGKSDSTIVMHSDRLEDDQKRVAGSWGGILFTTTSVGNTMQWLDMAGGKDMVRMQQTFDADTIPELHIENSLLYNASETLLDAGTADLYLYNTLIHTSVDEALKISGGTVYLDHVTVANLSNTLVRNTATIVLSGSGKYRLRNSIVWGYDSNEIQSGATDIAASYCLIKGSTLTGNNNLYNQDPKFVSSYYRDYSLAVGSPAIDAGLTMSGQDYDLKNKLRDASPDMGAYEK